MLIKWIILSSCFNLTGQQLLAVISAGKHSVVIVFVDSTVVIIVSKASIESIQYH